MTEVAEKKRVVNKPTHDTVIDINDTLRQVLVKQDDGTVEYKDGWSDESVAQKHGASENTVTNIRTSRFGAFKKMPVDNTEALRMRILRLERRLDNLVKALGHVE